jgi:hypothetical protein
MDRALVLVDEGLNSIGLEELNYVNQAGIVLVKPIAKDQTMILSPNQSPSPKEKACLAYKKEKGPPPQKLKCMFHFKPTFKWVMRSRAGEASSSWSKDPVVEAGRVSSDMGLAISSFTFLSGPPMGSSPALDDKDAGARVELSPARVTGVVFASRKSSIQGGASGDPIAALSSPTSFKFCR